MPRLWYDVKRSHISWLGRYVVSWVLCGSAMGGRTGTGFRKWLWLCLRCNGKVQERLRQRHKGVFVRDTDPRLPLPTWHIELAHCSEKMEHRKIIRWIRRLVVRRSYDDDGRCVRHTAPRVVKLVFWLPSNCRICPQHDGVKRVARHVCLRMRRGVDLSRRGSRKSVIKKAPTIIHLTRVCPRVQVHGVKIADIVSRRLIVIPYLCTCDLRRICICDSWVSTCALHGHCVYGMCIRFSKSCSIWWVLHKPFHFIGKLFIW